MSKQLVIQNSDASTKIVVRTTANTNSNLLGGALFTVQKLEQTSQAEIDAGFYFREGLTYDIQAFKTYCTNNSLQLSTVDEGDGTTVVLVALP